MTPKNHSLTMIQIETLLAWGATYKKLAADETIFQEGSEGRFYHQLVSGSVRWINITDTGKEFIQNIIEPGECFGELPLFDDGVYAASAVANKESVILRLNKNTFRQLLKEEPAIHFEFSKLMAERLRFKFFLLKELACSDPEHRISALFTYFKESRKNICTDCNQVQLTRQQIADMTGLRVETVIRSIKNLEHKGSVHIEKGKVFC
jgi:CRP/FNR family cyclic AMP-dependent transcriptional regulator